MSKISIKINRNNLYVADYDSASKTVHSNDDFTNRVAFDFLYRLFVEVVLRD